MTAQASISQLDHLIEPEISGDALARWLVQIAATPGVRQILEIGASSGHGSTAALYEGAKRNPEGPPMLHCIELSTARFRALAERYDGVPFVRCYHACSIDREAMPHRAEIEAYARSRTALARLRVRDAELLRWYDQDVEYLARGHIRFGGIALARARAGVEQFDAVLIDGSEFTGTAELREVRGSRYVVLDDIRTYKNSANYASLRADTEYRLVMRRRWLRNGCAVFERRWFGRTS